MVYLTGTSLFDIIVANVAASNTVDTTDGVTFTESSVVCMVVSLSKVEMVVGFMEVGKGVASKVVATFEGFTVVCMVMG